MRNYEFTKEEYYLLRELLKINKNIKEMYDKLFEIEISIGKDSKQYKEELNNLKKEIVREEQLYNIIGESIETLYAYADYLFPNGISELSEEIETLKEDNVNDLLKLRVTIRINNLIDNFIDKDFDKELEEFDIEDDMQEEELDTEKEFRRVLAIENTIEEDIINTILVMINKYLEKKDYDFIKDKLIKLKYNFSYIYKNIEYSMIKHNFEINSDLFLKTILVSELGNTNVTDALEVFYDFVNNIYHFQLDDIYYLLNNNIINNKEKIVITTIIIRSCMIYISKNNINDLKNTLDLELLLNVSDSNIVDNLINEMFEENPKDKEMPQILSLRP